MDTGRWTIIRHEAPERRRPSCPQQRRRVLARCVCGLEKVVWTDDIVAGRSTGCDSHRCKARWEVACDFRKRLDAWLHETGRLELKEMREQLAGLGAGE
jgi:hypothetical protein